MDEYNFTSGGGVPVEDIGVPGRSLPAFGQAQALRRATLQMQLESMRWSMHERASAKQLETQQREGMAKVGQIIANGRFDDPATLQKALGVAAQYGIQPEILDSMFKRFSAAEEYKQRMNLMLKEQSMITERRMEMDRMAMERLNVGSQAKQELQEQKFNLQGLLDQQRIATTFEEKGKLQEQIHQGRMAELAEIREGKIDVANIQAGGKPSAAIGRLERELDQAEVELAGYEALAKTQKKGVDHKIQTLGQTVGAMIQQKQAEIKALRSRLGEVKGGQGSSSFSNQDPLGLFDE